MEAAKDLADQLDAIHISEKDRQERNEAFHDANFRRDQLVERMEVEIGRIPGFERTALSWLLSSSIGKKAAAVSFFANNANSNSLDFFLYMLKHEGAFIQWHLLAIEKLVEGLSLHFEQLEPLSSQLAEYVGTLGESSRRYKAEELVAYTNHVLEEGPEKFHKKARLAQGALTASGGNGERFLSLWKRQVSGNEVSEEDLRNTLDADMFTFFVSLAADQPDLLERSILFWTADTPPYYKQINDSLIHDRDDLANLMPLIALLIAAIQRKPLAAATTTYRGSKLSAAQLEKYTVGGITPLGMFVASSLDEAKAEQFVLEGSPIVELHIPAGCPHATEVGEATFFKDEREVLVAPHTLVKCISKTPARLTLEVTISSQLNSEANLA